MRKVHIVYCLLFICAIFSGMQVLHAQTMKDSISSTHLASDTVTRSTRPGAGSAIPPPANPTGDTVVAKSHSDTLKPKLKHKFEPNPKRAGLYSAILPGLGQTYNRQYWKIPVVYALLGVGGYFIQYNGSLYREYRKAYIGRLTGDRTADTENTLPYSSDQLSTLQSGYKKYLDVTVLLTSVGYLLQVVDAVVFAHLKNFDMSQDISLRMTPIATPNGGAGLGFAFNVKPRHDSPRGGSYSFLDPRSIQH